ncbi:MAG TPA: SRPBCC family protein [Myxococcales bacterium]|nr:SRPBCC family protein [Myxococcales bacterium]
MKWLLSILGVSVVGAVLALVGLGARDGRGRATAAVELQHPPSSVFPLLVQPPLRKQWQLGVVDISPTGDPTLRSGARSRVTLEAPERMEVEEEIRVVETDRRVLLQRSSSHPPFNQRLEYVLKDLGGGRTLLTVAVHTIYQGLAFNLAEPLLTRAAQSQLDLEIEQLRSTADSPQPQVGGLPVVSTPTVAAGPPPTATPPATVVPAAAPVPTNPPPAASPPAAKPPEPEPPDPQPPPTEEKPPAEAPPPESDPATPP